jgi:hypothetical protein
VNSAPHRNVAPALAALALLCALSACGGPDRPATWAYISPVIFQPSCATSSCHSRAAAVAGLDFSDPDRGYSSLTRLWVWIVDRTKEGTPGCGHADGTIVCERLYRPLVTPYDPSQSRLVNMLRARNAPRMPPDRPLDEADIKLVENWILSGARKSESESDDGSAGVVDALGSDAGALDAPDALDDDAADGGSGDDGADGAADGARDHDDATAPDAGAPEASD